MPDLSAKAREIWEQLGENDRANSATTIAVVLCSDGKFYCTSNDVSSISSQAINKARSLGISTMGTDYISQAGAGFHAEMWAVLQAMLVDATVSNVLEQVGASRACCKCCSDVLAHLGVAAEVTSNDLYKIWYNPITMDEGCKARAGYEALQLKAIPDYRNFGKSYWFVPKSKGRHWQETAPDSAK